jgi:NAD(P)-dependent dehydrogenase (short-subunit alcohol dehydrogenase family)
VSAGRLADKVAIVTGGSAGIGAAIVRRFAREGALQVVAGTPGDLERKCAEVAEVCGERAVFVGVDLTEPGAADHVVAAALKAFGRLDVLVNNAGIDYSGVSLLETNLDVARRVFAVNVLAPLALMQAGARAMGASAAEPDDAAPTAARAGAGGVIVNIASRAGLVGVRSMAAYGASKAALISLTKAAALELAPAIRVNAVAPGMTEGPMMRAWIDAQPNPAAFARDLVASIPQGRMATPEEIAAAVLFLASAEARHITGAVLTVDGGYTAG